MEPNLIIMAAGMGSRYGGLKQIDPITEAGEIILDFSLYDAFMAGFKKVIFVIKEENQEDFAKFINGRSEKFLDVEYAYQKLEDIPSKFHIPKDRVKPWGTAHAIMAARDKVTGPFAVINADDYYGPEAFHKMYDFLANTKKDGEFAMISYMLKNTVTENGHVARGVCQVDEKGLLADIVERTKIMKVNGQICFTEDDENWIPLKPETQVSMNLWGYTKNMMDELVARIEKFLEEALTSNPLKGEYQIPTVTNQLIKEGKATVKVLNTKDKWYGVTYKEDKEMVSRAIEAMKDKGLYPEILWG
ncbi:MAG: sugar phosphate nucleotidyltransferase [Anaerovoracaceae bacterium]